MPRPTEAHVGGLGSVRCGDTDKGIPWAAANAAAPATNAVNPAESGGTGVPKDPVSIAQA